MRDYENFIPYIRVWSACMLQAVDDCWSKEAMLREPARGWVASESDRPGGFVWACRVFDLDPQRTRGLILGNRQAYAILRQRVTMQERRRRRMVRGECDD